MSHYGQPIGRIPQPTDNRVGYKTSGKAEKKGLFIILRGIAGAAFPESTQLVSAWMRKRTAAVRFPPPPEEYKVSFHRLVGSVAFLVEVCREDKTIRTNVWVHLLNRHVRYMIVIVY